jgi:mono/diheme cytochrome c family protein
MKIKYSLLWIVVTACFSLTLIPARGEPIELEKLGAIQGIGVHPLDPSSLYLATNNGLYLTTQDKQAELLSRNNDNLISIAVAHDKASTLYASGHPPIGGNLGLLRSKDYGRSWEKISTDPNGPIALEKLTVSHSDPDTIYGVYQGLRVSHDGGNTWLKVAAEPPGLFGLAVSGHDSRLLYAAARDGLYVSRNGGRSWNDPYQFRLPVTMVRTTADNMLYAFIVSKGLMRTPESATAWQPLYNQFGSQLLLDMTVAPGNPARLFAVNQFGRLLASMNKGESWHRFTGDPKPVTEATRRGEKLYVTHCQECHGLQGVGENYSEESLNNRNYLMATSLDDSTHAWHHSDDDLVNTILEGSPRNDRMQAWKAILSEQNARDIVAYMKSLWGQRALDCQGPKHMQCM